MKKILDKKNISIWFSLTHIVFGIEFKWNALVAISFLFFRVNIIYNNNNLPPLCGKV